MVNIPGPRQFFNYVYDMRLFLAIVIGLFLVSAALGYFIPGWSPEASKSLLSGLQSKAESLAGQPPLLMMLGIFFNNAAGAIMAMLFGLAAGLFTLFFVVTNGMVIGIVLEMMVSKLGAAGGGLLFLAGILPHGIFELPAIFLSTAIGLRLGYEALRSLITRKDTVTPQLTQGLLIFFFWILPILFVAAVVETFVTGALIASLT
jgi:stage II sporulation protein M